ncbi:hypothetical protein TGAM01_v201085 [Trichoderma gamsii]|uniref:Uncharacterized protein n=1 Tax=Trichoderma gamsii TaxID=398673 RepID=A0A2P4ZZI8_9HYPO|nr:hypothetical protein TGAM01_v201085 [Trichoderma gamsii]PON29719.1 hypothetical protein TGAM01_v201085 [Trichoderma gamsii]
MLPSCSDSSCSGTQVCQPVGGSIAGLYMPIKVCLK